MKDRRDRRAARAAFVAALAGLAGVSGAPLEPQERSAYSRKSSWVETMATAREAYLQTAEGRQLTPSGAGTLPWDSGPVRGDGPAVRVSLTVSGVKTLALISDTLEGVANCNIWGEPRLVGKDGKETRLTSLKPAYVKVGWGQLLQDKNWQDHPLRVGDKTFSYGIWVHSASEVRYELGGKYDRFEAWAGEDKDRATGTVRFRVTAGEPPTKPAYWESMTRDYPLETAWMSEDLGGSGALLWFANRPDAGLEQSFVGRIVGQTGPAGQTFQAELESLRKGNAPAGDRRWIDLYVRARRVLGCALVLKGIREEAARSALEKDLEKLVALKTPPEAPAWGELRRKAVFAEEIDSQHQTLAHDLSRRADFQKFAREIHRPESLIQASDRDPLDIVLRRTAALLADLKRTTAAPRLAAAEERLARLQKAGSETPPADAAARRTLFAEACAVRRQVAFANPLLDFKDILFIKRHRALYDHMCDQYYGMAVRPGGGLYVLSDAFGPNPQVRDVLAGSVVQKGRLKGQKLSGGPVTPPPLNFDGVGNVHGPEAQGGSFLSPDLSYDGKTALFAYVECRGDPRHRHHTDASRGHWDEGRCYHVFKVGLDGSNLDQLTDGTWNDFDPCWLPNGRIAFISERRGGYLRCGRVCPTYTLYDMAADGSSINMLSPHETNEWHPSVSHEGRIIYTRWDYVDRHGCTAHHPWITTLDGRDSRALHGNFAPRPLRPDMELDCQSVPGSHRYLALAAPHHGQAYGSIIIIDPSVPDDDAMAPVRRVTPDVGFPESQGGREVYGTPLPLGEDYYLCVYDASMARGGSRRGALGDYGIYLVDSFGNKELIYRDPEISCLSPIPVRPRRMPQAAPPAVANPLAAIAPGARGEATIAVMNVYDSLKGWPSGTQIKALRIYQVLPMPVPSGGPPHETGLRVAEAGDSVVPARWVLGTVPVEKDGSAHFKVPAYRELFFQALDGSGQAVQSMRSATYLRDGEFLTCVGCHEPKSRTPLMPGVMPLALQRPPTTPRPDVDGSNPFSYPRLVQPVLDRKCAECHAKSAPKFPLGKDPIQNRWFASYNTLVKYGFTRYGDGYRTTPGKFGAKASKLLELLGKGHYDVKLSEEEYHRIALWLDSSSMFYGVYEKEGGEAQLRGEIPKPTLE